MLRELLFPVLFLISASHCSENNASIGTADFGYELTVSGLDAINFNMQKDHLRSRQQFQSLGSEIADLRRTLANIERMITRQSTSQTSLEVQMKEVEMQVKKVENGLDTLSLNVSGLMIDAGQIYRVQQTLPTTEMMNDLILRLIAGQLRPRDDSKVVPFDSKELPRSCDDVPDRRTGLQQIRPQPGFSDSFEVLCDQDYEGGGWTVIQNRYDGSVYFYRGWNDYVNGFGDLRGEFWLGLNKIHELTYAKRHELHVVLEDFDGKIVVAKYDHFLVGGSEVQFALESLGNYSGTAGDSLSFAKGMKFTTLDTDNDTHPPENCAVIYKGGWWYAACHGSNLNGLYLKGERKEYALMMCWKTFRGLNYGLKRSRMMIRATNSSLE